MGRKELLEIAQKKEHTTFESQTKKTEYEKPKGIRKKLENFMYHYKWVLVSCIVAVIMVSVFVRDILMRVDYDLSIVIAGEHVFFEDGDYDIIIQNLESVAPDINGDGEVHVALTPITMTNSDSPASMEMQSANQIKLMGELSAQSSYIYIIDRALYDSSFAREDIFVKSSYDGDITELISVDQNKIFTGSSMESNDLFIAILDSKIVNTNSKRNKQHYSASLEAYNNIIDNK